MRVLILEDDTVVGRALALSLEQSGYAADWVRDGRAAELALSAGAYDLALVYVGLLRAEGLEAALKILRRANVHVPVLVTGTHDLAKSIRRLQPLNSIRF
jgi:DNA-binding response OmpR family regulator